MVCTMGNFIPEQRVQAQQLITAYSTVFSAQPGQTHLTWCPGSVWMWREVRENLQPLSQKMSKPMKQKLQSVLDPERNLGIPKALCFQLFILFYFPGNILGFIKSLKTGENWYKWKMKGSKHGGGVVPGNHRGQGRGTHHVGGEEVFHSLSGLLPPSPCRGSKRAC